MTLQRRVRMAKIFMICLMLTLLTFMAVPCLIIFRCFVNDRTFLRVMNEWEAYVNKFMYEMERLDRSVRFIQSLYEGKLKV